MKNVFAELSRHISDAQKRRDEKDISFIFAELDTHIEKKIVDFKKFENANLAQDTYYDLD